MSIKYILVSFIILLSCSLAKADDFVKIGYVKNSPNRYGYGAVSYMYNIGRYEITNKEYCDFLNCVASPNDTYNLYSPLMQQHFMGGIVRIKTPNGIIYRCKENYENRPVVCTTWMNAIRYINWLHYNAYNIQKGISIDKYIKTTEGDEYHGAYNTRNVPEKRNKGARYWLPNRSEWEKAAYYNGKEWLYGYAASSGNYYDSKSGWGGEYPHIAPVGRCEGPNGTYDQQGNAAEWVEDSRDDGWKLALGGSLIRPKNFAFLGETEGDAPNMAISTIGFRVCQALSLNIYSDSISDINIVTSGGTNKTSYKLLKMRTNKFDCFGTPYVRITDVNNIGDVVNQYKGSVSYEYYISRTELSNAEYCAFLNAVASHSDPFHLYHDNMGTGVCGGILRDKTKNGFRYTCKAGWAHRPIVYISYYDLARYANWMHYGCPEIGVSKLGTTEGDNKQGAYNIILR